MIVTWLIYHPIHGVVCIQSVILFYIIVLLRKQIIGLHWNKKVRVPFWTDSFLRRYENRMIDSSILIIFILFLKFGELTGCCHDIVSNLCNYDKIHSLVSNGNTSVWRKSIIMAIHQLRDRFPTYPDLVQPFTASLTIVSINSYNSYNSCLLQTHNTVEPLFNGHLWDQRTFSFNRDVL